MMLSLTHRLKSMVFKSPSNTSTLEVKETTTPPCSLRSKPSEATMGQTVSRVASKLSCVPNSSVAYAYSASNTLPLKRKRAPFQCIICLSDYTNNNPHNTDKCQHSMCRGCARQYFSDLLEKPMERCDLIACPYPNCKEYFVTDKTLYNFFTKAEIKKWWTNAIIQTHIENRVNTLYPIIFTLTKKSYLDLLSYASLSCCV